jgi:two-component system, chemotaxis family, response regulator WspR
MTENLLPSLKMLPAEQEIYQAMVLLVDDQVMIAEAVRRALAGQSNLEYHYCLNPHEAVAVARDIKPTVILQDLIMPGVDGLDMVRRYRTTPETMKTPIIVLSSREEPVIKSQAFADGANDYLVKIPDKIELIARIRYHTKAYLNHLQRDEAYRALQESQQLLMHANLKLERMTRVDGLTSLGNRRYCNEYLATEWKRQTRNEELLTILMIDVDNFKAYNDTYGHLAGDEVLIRVAESIQRVCARPGDFTARFGGEEFIMILSGTSAEGGQNVATKLRDAVSDMAIPHAGSKATETVTISVGIASAVPKMDQSPNLLIEAADRALFRAKAAGKNRVVVAGPSDMLDAE